MKQFMTLTGFFLILGLLFYACDSSIGTSDELTEYDGEIQTQTFGPGALIQGNVVTVTEEDLGPSDRPDDFGEPGYEVPEYDWYTPTHDDPLNTDGATYGFVAEPDHPLTSGNGSFLFDVPMDERSWILTDQYGTGEWHGEPDAKEGTRLDEITTLAYSTFISNEFSDGSSQTATVVPSMQIMAQDADGVFLPLIFDPPSGDAVTGEWQRWNATKAAGWRTESWAPCIFDDGSTWNEVVEACEDAKVLWAIAVAAGTWPNQDFHGYTDLLTVGVNGEETTYDFEVLPATKQDCMRSGWREFDFRNQGQCIRFVNTGKDSR